MARLKLYVPVLWLLCSRSSVSCISAGCYISFIGEFIRCCYVLLQLGNAGNAWLQKLALKSPARISNSQQLANMLDLEEMANGVWGHSSCHRGLCKILTLAQGSGEQIKPSKETCEKAL